LKIYRINFARDGGADKHAMQKLYFNWWQKVAGWKKDGRQQKIYRILYKKYYSVAAYYNAKAGKLTL